MENIEFTVPKGIDTKSLFRIIEFANRIGYGANDNGTVYGLNKRSGYHYCWSEYESYTIGLSYPKNPIEIIITDPENGNEYAMAVHRPTDSLVRKIEKAVKIVFSNVPTSEKKNDLWKLNFIQM